MSDVKSFTGFIAIDSSTHTTLKAAVEHTREVKVKAALQAFADAPQDATQVIESGSDRVVFVQDLPAFLLANRTAILAAYNQEVLTRKPRAPRASKAAAAAAGAIKAEFADPTTASTPKSLQEELAAA